MKISPRWAAAIALISAAPLYASDPATIEAWKEAANAFQKASPGSTPATRDEFEKCYGYWYQWSEHVSGMSEAERKILPAALKPDAAKAQMAAMNRIGPRFFDPADAADVKALNAKIGEQFQNAGFAIGMVYAGGSAVDVFLVLRSCGRPQ